MRGAAHQHDRFHGEREGADVHLGHIGDDARAFADRIGAERSFVEPHLAGLRLEQAEQGFEQCRLAAAVRAEQREHLAGCERHVEPAPDCVVGIADGEITAGEVHDQFLCMLASSQMKNGVPTTAVKMPSGISTSAAVRASVSISSR